MSSCKHNWSEVKYVPELNEEHVFSHVEGFYPYQKQVYNYRTVLRDKWSRQCKECKEIEYTYEKTKFE